jgi:hypothetical protein
MCSVLQELVSKGAFTNLLHRDGMYIFRPLLHSVRTARFTGVSSTRLDRATARMAKLVDAWDLKSPARKGVPVRFRLRAPS